jgi:predicted DNA-binding transcriptional regulator YafY
MEDINQQKLELPVEIIYNDQLKIVEIVYTNWQKKTSVRNILPRKIFFGATKYHLSPQWILEAFDIDKQEVRFFAMKDIIKWKLD